jgi:hypothetical protein
MVRDDVYGCWRNDGAGQTTGGAADLCFSPDARVVYKGKQNTAAKQGASDGYEFAVVDQNLIFIDKGRSIPSGICKIGGQSTQSAIELSCDESGKIYSGKWKRRCTSVNAEGTDCLGG